MTDVFRLLPPFQWRGRKYPVTARSVSFAHDGADHKLQYRDDEIVEQLGAQGLTFSYTVPMREGIARGPYKSLFNEGLPVLFRDVRNRSADALIDPVYGEFRCVPKSFNDDSDVNKRDGTDIRLEFKLSPELGNADPELAQTITGIQGLVSDAGALDEEVKAADWAQEPSPEGMTDVLSAINGIGQQGLAQVDKLSAALDDLAFKCEKIEKTADRAENPQNWPLRNSARRDREAALRLKRRLAEDPARKIVRVTRRTATTVSSLAAELGMSVVDLIKLNPALARSPIVRPGTPYSAPQAR